jgi:carbonic anhydrase
MGKMKISCTIIMMFLLCFQNQAIAYNPNMSPKEALQRLTDGNKRFLKDKSICPDRNQDRRAATVAKQKPFAVVLGCSDSRVPPELAFDQGIGDIFVVRVAGNVVGATELDSVEYSAIYNGSAIIVVLGHSGCGAIEAVLADNTKEIEAIANLIHTGVNKHTHKTVDTAVIANVYNSVERIKKSPPIAKLIKAGKVDVVGAVYGLETGEIRILPDM